VLRPIEVTAPDGSRWTVGRKVLPWRPKRRIRGDGFDLPGVSFGDFAGDDPISLVLGVIAAVLLFLALLVLLGPMFGLLVLGFEWLVVLALGFLGVVGRLLLGRPFVVYAAGSEGSYQVTRVSGWREAGREAREWAECIRATGRPG
jgi:hypothetical protein